MSNNMSASELPSIAPVKFDSNSYCAQEQSPLFDIPGEIRDRIFALALAPFEDMSQAYETKTYYSRPEYLAPHKSDATLLRTCQRVYNEAWFRLWVSSEHTFWLGNSDRAPTRREGINGFTESLQRIHSIHGVVELDHIRFFSQLFALEPGSNLMLYLSLPHFYPRCITITIRHTDWWYWEDEEDLHIESRWVRHVTFPNSLQQLRLEMESLEQRKDSINSIASQMKKKWHFRRQDGIQLWASDREDHVTRWQGSSTLNHQRWIRDELTAGKLDYYIKTVVWRADPSRKVDGENLSGDIRSKVNVKRSNDPRPTILSHSAQLAGITDDDPADVVREKYAQWLLEHPDDFFSMLQHTPSIIYDWDEHLDDDDLVFNETHIDWSSTPPSWYAWMDEEDDFFSLLFDDVADDT